MKVETITRRDALLWGAGAGLAVTVIMLPCLIATYGIYDAVRMAHDYGWLGQSRFTGVMQGGGRFLYALVAEAAFLRMRTIEDLVLLRAIGTTGLALVTAWMAFRLRRMGMGGLWALACVLVCLVNPGTATYAFWSACFPYAYAVLLALFAGETWERESLSARVVSIILLQISFLIYQPAALFFPLLPIVGWYLKGEKVRPMRPLWTSLGVGLGMVLHLVIARIGMQLLPGAIDQGGRIALGDLPETAGQLITDLIPRIFAHWGGLLRLPLEWTGFTVGLTGVALFFTSSRCRGDFLARVLTMIPVMAGFIAALVSADNYTPYRLLAPAYALLWTIALLGWHGWLSGDRIMARMVALVLALAAGTSACVVVQTGVAGPRDREVRVLYSALQDLPAEPEGLIVIRPDGTYPISQVIRQQAEYGAYELSFDGFSESFLSLLAARAYGWPPETIPLNRIHWLFYPPETKTVPSIYGLLDLRVRLQGHPVEGFTEDPGSRSRHPYLGESVYYAPNLYQSDRYGIIQQDTDNWFFHPGDGWMQWDSKPGEFPIMVRDVRGQVREWPTPSAE